MLGSTGELLSHNVFAYCANNPVNNYDPSGRNFLDIFTNIGNPGGFAGAVVAAVVTIAIVAVCATGVGAIAFAGICAGAAIVGSIAGQVVEDVVNEEPISIDPIEVVVAGACGFLGGLGGYGIAGLAGQALDSIPGKAIAYMTAGITANAINFGLDATVNNFDVVDSNYKAAPKPYEPDTWSYYWQ